MSAMEPGFNLVSSFAGYPTPPSTPYMVDDFGDIRWILDFTNHPVLKNLYYKDGIARLQNGDYYFGDDPTTAIYEVDVFGKVVQKWGLGAYRFHHNITEKPNGNFLVTVTYPPSTNTSGNPTIYDYILEIDRATGNFVNVWDLKQSMDENSLVLPGVTAEDWFHANAVIYDPSDNT